MADEAQAGAAALLYRYVLQERMRARFRPGTRVLNLGCGGGEDALWLASFGASVLGLDPSEAAVQRARRAGIAAGVGTRVRFEVRRADELRVQDGSFDGAFAAPGALAGVELPVAGRALAAVLREGAPVLVSVSAPRPALARLGARQRAQRSLGPAFAWRRGFGIGVVLPGGASSTWAARSPHAFAALALLERFARDAPVWRDLGDHLILDGARL
ncbi:MAG TPA: class I SAM-dependent methyltransferase [Vicinamibacteria bacterium]|jgi:SAM-dependent methyltransferase